MIYYDQGMFEEVNYMTSAIPAEMLAGGVSINMVTKDGGNQWKGNLRYNFSNESLQGDNFSETKKLVPTFRGNPTDMTYDLNFNGGGALVQNKLWVNGTIRKWVVNKFVNATNDDGSQALDDNDLQNYSGKGVYQLSANQKLIGSYFWNNKIRGHRRDSNDIIPDIASRRQTNPVQTTQAKYTGISGSLVFESNFSMMDGQTNYLYSRTPIRAVRIIDTGTTEVFKRIDAEEHQPNSRTSSTTFTCGKSGLGGEHLFKGGVQWGRLYFSDYSVMNDHWLVYNNRCRCRCASTTRRRSRRTVAKVTGFFCRTLVDEPADAEHRRPLGQVRRHDAGPVDAGRTLLRRALRAGQRSHQPQPRCVASRRGV
jgi:hypothetical protein